MTYSPFSAPGSYLSGPVSQYPWPGEDFSGYNPLPGVPDQIACSDANVHPHFDVTSGCIDAVLIGSQYQYTRGQLRCPTVDFRMLALGRDPSGLNALPVKWTAQGIRFRFHGHQTRDSNWPGVKAFARYRTEDDLYVASWRFDGVAQIQKKQAGTYSTLAVNSSFGAPSPDEWHWLAFEALGQELRLYLDDQLALSCTSATFSWGTCGIRIDGADGMYLDDWTVYQPVA